MTTDTMSPTSIKGSFTLDRLLIDGELVDPGATLPTLNPATGEEIAQAPEGSIEHAEAAIQAARKAFDTTDWATNVALRARCLRQLRDAMLAHSEELRTLTIVDAGHTVRLTRGPALDDPIKLLTYYADLAESYEWRESLPDSESYGRTNRRWVEKEPAGVVSAIIAYNYPTQLALAKLAPALAAGCTVILKGAPDTPLITLALAELIHNETDIPAGVVNIISSSSIDAAELLTGHPEVDMITFTGSTPVGRRIMEVASATIKRVFLELGGKSALIVLDDADLTAPAMVAASTICSHSGQGCAITSRVLVPRARHDEFVAMVKSNMENIVQGDPADEATYMGPLISEKQRDKVDAIVQRAVAAGATLVCGGERINPGFFYSPTLLTNADPDSEVAQDELFGPVLVVLPYDDDDDAVRIANNSIYGLSGSIVSADEDRAIGIARRIRTGTIGVNGGAWYGADTPFGGYKQAGIGREMGIAGLEEFIERKTIAVPASS